MNTYPFLTTLKTLIEDPAVAGISMKTTYRSPLPAIAPPAGTLRADGKDVRGEFELPDGRQAVIIDSVGSQASRMEAAAEELAEAIHLPMVRFRKPDGTLLTTSLRLSHRHADATWRAAKRELTDAGIPFAEIQDATIQNASPLLQWFPTAVLMGWWHSQVRIADDKKRAEENKARAAALGKDATAAEAAETLEGYAQLSPDMRSARIMTSEIIATGVHRRRRMPAKVDSLFGPLAKKSDKGPSSLGLGSLPPVQESKAVIDVTYEDIQGNWWLSLAGLRQFDFGATHPDPVLLLTCLALLLHEQADRDTRLRSGTELIAVTTQTEAWRHSNEPEPLQLPNHDELVDMVATLSTQAAWTGPTDVTIGPDSVLSRIISLGAKQAESPAEDA